jgi:hypothetical protein
MIALFSTKNELHNQIIERSRFKNTAENQISASPVKLNIFYAKQTSSTV